MLVAAPNALSYGRGIGLSVSPIPQGNAQTATPLTHVHCKLYIPFFREGGPPFYNMEIHPLHGLKKGVAKHTTRKKVAKDIGEEYLDNKAALATIQKQLEAYNDATDASHHAWCTLQQTQREFSSNMTSSYPRQDAVRATAAQFASNLTALQAASTLSDGDHAQWRKLHGTVQKYLGEIAEVQKQYQPLENSYSEYLRYISKSDKLSAKKKPNQEKINRNLAKREAMRNEYQSNLDKTVNMMRTVLRKHPAVYQCALTSFWLRNQNQFTLFADHTGQMHSECAAIADTLLKVDLTVPNTFESLLPANADPLPQLPPPSVPHEHIPSIIPAPPPAVPSPAPAPTANGNGIRDPPAPMAQFNRASVNQDVTTPVRPQPPPVVVAPPPPPPMKHVSAPSPPVVSTNGPSSPNGKFGAERLPSAPVATPPKAPAPAPAAPPAAPSLLNKAAIKFPSKANLNFMSNKSTHKTPPAKESPAKESLPRPHVFDVDASEPTKKPSKLSSSRPHVFSAFLKGDKKKEKAAPPPAPVPTPVIAERKATVTMPSFGEPSAPAPAPVKPSPPKSSMSAARAAPAPVAQKPASVPITKPLPTNKNAPPPPPLPSHLSIPNVRKGGAAPPPPPPPAASRAPPPPPAASRAPAPPPPPAASRAPAPPPPRAVPVNSKAPPPPPIPGHLALAKNFSKGNKAPPPPPPIST